MMRFLLGLIFTASVHLIFASPKLKQKAFRGDAKAQLRLAFKEINSEPPNWSGATSWLEMAAIRGDKIACNLLGLSYSSGLGVSKNTLKSLEWWELGASLGSMNCIKSLAINHSNEGNKVKALSWKIIYKKSGFKDQQDDWVTQINPINELEFEQAKLLADKIENSWKIKRETGITDPLSHLEKFGELTLPNGSYYKGTVLDNTPHGYGMKVSANGAVYYGYFSNGLECGYGTSFGKNGYIIFQGHWIDGNPISK